MISIKNRELIEYRKKHVKRLHRLAFILHQLQKISYTTPVVQADWKPYDELGPLGGHDQVIVFNMLNWGRIDDECGTVCCAAGWATQDPELNKEGFFAVNPSARLNRNDLEPMFSPTMGERQLIEIVSSQGLDWALTEYDLHLYPHVYQGVVAIQAFFGISHDDVEDIFYAEAYDLTKPLTPAMVAERVSKRIKAIEKEFTVKAKKGSKR